MVGYSCVYDRFSAYYRLTCVVHNYRLVFKWETSLNLMIIVDTKYIYKYINVLKRYKYLTCDETSANYQLTFMA